MRSCTYGQLQIANLQLGKDHRMPAKPAPRKNDAGPKNDASPKQEPKILFQKYFKSIGPRTYAAQVKEAGNGNHFLVLTEGKRDDKTGEVRKTRLFVFSEDFVEFFKMLHETVQFIKANPVSDEVKERQKRYWSRKADASADGGQPTPPVASASPAPSPVPKAPVGSKGKSVGSRR
jgi:hypothetical protein